MSTVLLRWLSVQFSIELDTRRVYVTGITDDPTGEWVTQQARNLSVVLTERVDPAKFFIRVETPNSPPASTRCSEPRASVSFAHPLGHPEGTLSQRFVGTVRRESLDRLLAFQLAQLECISDEFVAHDNRHVRTVPLVSRLCLR
jgi:hypothetical protein